MSAQGTPKSKAVDLLLRAQIIDRSHHEHVSSVLGSSQDRSEDVLVDLDVLSEAALLKALAGIYRTHFVSTEKLSKADIPKATVQLIPRRVAGRVKLSAVEHLTLTPSGVPAIRT